ncbi:MAG: NAD-dependent deacetylase [Planctomycetota bacterium]
MDISIEAARERIRQARRIIVLTGAGISVASGLPVYRGETGSRYDEPDALRHAMAGTLREDPAAYWRRFGMRRAEFLACTPNAAHRMLAQFIGSAGERQQQVLLTTTNIDNLHRRAGSHDVIEMHGNAFYLRCLDDDCDSPAVRDETDPDASTTAEIPRCRRCGNLMRPDVVLFGEGAPAKWQPVRDFAAAGGVDVAVLIGLSGVVTVDASLLACIVEHGPRPWVLDVNPRPRLEGRVIDAVVRAAAEEAVPALFRVSRGVPGV